MATFSHSRISSFENCKLKYKYAYIDKIETEISGSIEAFMGSIVHKALEKLYKDLNFEKKNTKEEILEFYDKEWENAWDESIKITKEEYSKENYKDMGRRMLKEYYERYAPFNQAKTIGLETEEFYDLDENHKIHVRIDRLSSPEEGVYEIHDYKTNSALKTQEEADEDRQLAVYSMGVKKIYPDAKKIKLIWHMLAFDREVVSERTDAQLESLRQEILDEIKKIEEEKSFEPTKSGLCNYCEFQKICPLWKHLFEARKVNYSKDAGVLLVNKYAKLKEQEKNLQEEIQKITEMIYEFSEQHKIKAVFGEHNQVTIWSKDAMKFPNKDDPERAKFVNAVKALNLWDKYVDLDKWTFEKEFDSFSEIEKGVLRNFGKKETVKRLYMRKKDF